MRLNRQLLYSVLSVLIVTSVHQKTEQGRKPSDKNVVALNSEGESEPAERKAKSTFADLAISSEDIELVEDTHVPPPPPPLTPGEEYMPEKPAANSDEHVEATYQQALRFLERGRGHGAEGKKAAYRLLDQAAQSGHTDAMKLMAYAHLFGDRARWSIDEARKIFEELAENGSPDAQLGLAFMHATGLGMAKSNQAKALIYYMFSALGGNPLAQMAMGYRYYAGIAVPQNCENALSYYEKAAQKVAEGFRFSTGLAIQRIRLTDEMEPSSTNTVTVPMDQNLIEYYRFLAEKGDVSAQVGLGQLYLTGGRGVEQNFDLANKYFSSAAESGHAGAFAFLGKMYLDGTYITPQDNTTAFNLFLRSADKGNQNGQAGLGVMYLQGRGVRKDYEKAYRLFSLAAEQGWVDAQLYLGEMYFKGLGVKRDFKSALKYYQMATQNGHILASYNLARMHSSGIGVLRQCTTAVEFYKNVAERGRWGERLMEAYTAYKEGRRDEAAIKYLFLAELGYEPAQTNIAYILDRGEADSLFPSSKENVLERAIVQWQRAANQEYPLARIKLGDYHYYGWGTPADYQQAAQHYKLAVERHATAQAMFNLGLMHEQGLGITRDLHLAKRFYDMAAEQSSDAAVPVALALAKLTVLFILEQINKNPVVQLLENYVGPNWDIVAMSILAGVPMIIFLSSGKGHVGLGVSDKEGPSGQGTSGELWKTITSVSRAGQKKGRMATRQPIRPLNRFYRIGSSPMKVQFPGLNAPLNTADPDAKIVEQTEEEIKEGQLSVRKTLEEQKDLGRRRFREKLHPLERGFSGTQLVGQKLGPPAPVDGVSFDDFQTYCLEVKRTSNMTRVFGRVHTMAALVITGNGKGLAGYAVGKAPLHRTTTAIVNGMNMASRKLFFVELLEGRTIFQDFYAECRNTRVFAQRRPHGFGLTCHPRLIKICEAIGIKDIYVKVEGSTKNYLALTHAFVTGLLNQETHQQLAERKGLHVVEMSPSRHFLPQVVASPILTPLKEESELEDIDRLNLDDFYGEGRYPLRKPKPLPFYVYTPGHQDAEWRKHPYRNHEEVMIRLLADGVVPRWTRDARRKWSEERHEKALAGVEPMPSGIGLSEVIRKSE